MNNFNFSAARATSALGFTSLLGVHGSQAQSGQFTDCNLPAGNTTVGQSTNQSVNAAGTSSVNVMARGLAGPVAALSLTKLDREPVESTPHRRSHRPGILWFGSLQSNEPTGNMGVFIPLCQLMANRLTPKNK